MLSLYKPFSFTVTASDPFSTTNCTFELFYYDTNHYPIVVNSTFSIPLFSPISTFVGHMIAFDSDFNQTLSYSIQSFFSFFLINYRG